jgi:hypothetical protein
MKTKYIVSYHREAIYSDGTKDARLEIGEEFENISLHELIDLIENNEKSLTFREDDLIDFSKDVELTSLNYTITTVDGNVVHNTQSHDVLICFRYLLDDFDKCERLLNGLGLTELDDPTIEIKNHFTEILGLFQKGLKIDENLGRIIENTDHLLFHFKLPNSFYAYNSFLVEFSKQYANFLVMTLNSEVELIQLYSKGYLDEGVASGENWDYLMEDYGTDLIDLLEGSNL